LCKNIVKIGCQQQRHKRQRMAHSVLHIHRQIFKYRLEIIVFIFLTVFVYTVFNLSLHVDEDVSGYRQHVAVDMTSETPYEFVSTATKIEFLKRLGLKETAPLRVAKRYITPKKTHVTIEDYKLSFDDDKDAVNKHRRTKVRDAMKHAFSNYAKYAWGKDELCPISKQGHNWLPNGAGLTIVDAVDTLFIMGLEEEYQKSVQYFMKEVPQISTIDNYVSLFEITIRMLGGFLSAYDLSYNEIFLVRAKELADRLMPAFNTESGIPHNNVNLKTGDARTLTSCFAISEFGTLSLEFTHLSDLTGDPKYRTAIEKVTDIMYNQRDKLKNPGLFPANYSPIQNNFCTTRVTLGALGDSFYEYLLKQWLLRGVQDERYRKMFEESVKGIIDHLVVRSPKGWTYISEMENGQNVAKIDHLVCFAAGMLALASATNATLGLDAQKYNTLQTGRDFIRTCYTSYTSTTTGLGPEIYRINDAGDVITDAGSTHYILRPETVESLFILYRVTGDSIYREWGWNIFSAIEKNCRVDGGYSGVRDVGVTPPAHDDKQQSFFLAETLKYLYLLFSPVDVIPLNEWVFNTEAHPFKIKS
jgi:mannosyl-oligosaccharide alpha-1,2-mannosidase